MNWSVKTFILFLLLSSLNMYATIMSNGTYKIQSDIFDSTSTTASYISGGAFDMMQSPGQSCVVGVEVNGATTNYSGFMPDGGNPIANNLTKGQKYPTIQSAIDDSSKGDYIQISPGEFAQPINLAYKTNIVLEAKDWATNHNQYSTILIGDGVNPVVDMSISFKCKVVGFTIKQGSYGIFVSSHSPNSNYYAHNVISSNGIGIGITNGNWNTITSNTFYECTNAVFITGNSKTNSIFSNSMYNNYYAVQIDSGAHNKIVLNNMQNNYWGGVNISASAPETFIDSNIIKNSGMFGIYLADDNSDFCTIINNQLSGPSQNYGIRVFDSDSMVIRNNTIHNHIDDGIYINGASSDNQIGQNNFYSNAHSGVHIEAGVQNSSIATNSIWGLTQAYGIYIDGAGPNSIFSNQIFQNKTNGIYMLNSSMNNSISNNVIFSNDTAGIQVRSANADNNRIVFNHIYGLNQNYGIWMRDGDDNTIYSNQIYQNQVYGVYVYNTATYNEIKNNGIFSNASGGISVYGESCDNNSIKSNKIYGSNQGNGIIISYADDCDISRNLIKDGTGSGIRLINSTTNIQIINNTIYAFGSDGVYGADSSSARIHNNIFILNSGYGINNQSSNPYIASYNDFYMNSSASSNGNVLWGDGNITDDPQIDTTSTFEITSSSSPAVDSGTNILNDYFMGPDMGWKETSFFKATADILVIDDDTGASYESYYTNALTSAGYTFNYWNIQNNGSLSISVITQFNVLVWFTGDDYQTTITSSDTNALNYYLNMGKKLFISGQDIGFDIGNNGSPAPTSSWYHQYLKAQFVGDDSDSYMIDGISGDPVFNGVHLVIDSSGDGAGNQNYQSYITTNQGSQLILQYTNATAQYAGIKYDGAYRLIYFAFGFEGINNATDRSNTMYKVINWLYNGDPPPPGTGPFYVATTGNDFVNNGSYTNPFKTIQHAADVMSAGLPNCTVATTYIFPGLYNEQVNIASNKNPGYMVITALSNNNKPVLKKPIVGIYTNYAFFITNADNVILQNMEIKGYAKYGICLTGNATNVHIENNIIASNVSGGIRIAQEFNDNNYIVSNIIFGGGQNNGIEITYGDNTYIYGNKIFNNQQFGIWVYWIADDNYIAHNEIYSNNSYGLNFTTTGNQFYTNQIYHNDTGVSIAYGGNNLIKSNSIYSNTGRGIEISQCNNNSVISNQIFGNAQEGIYLERKGHQVIGNKIFLNKSVGIQGFGQTNEIINNDIYKNTRGIELSVSTNYYIADNTIYSNNSENISINNSIDTTISNNILFHSSISNWSSGINVNGDATKDLYIKNNLIYSNVYHSTNFQRAIFIQGNITNVVIYSNEFYGVGNAIRNEGADFVFIKNNFFHDLHDYRAVEIDTNWNGGVNAQANFNTVASNTFIGNGVQISFGGGHTIGYNTFRNISTNDTAVSLDTTTNFMMNGNIIKNSGEGIFLDASTGDILYNSIYSNRTGINLKGTASYIHVKYNYIADNTEKGLQIEHWDGLPVAQIRYNNFEDNNENFVTSTNYDVRTNWWGTSIKGAIQSKFGLDGPPPIVIDFGHYRLWHEYNLSLGADRENLSSVTVFTAYVTNSSVRLRWNNIPADPDFTKYYVYQSSSGDYGNLDHVINVITNTTSTNILLTPPDGVYYYWVTVGDNPTPPSNNVLTNESWYSPMQSVVLGTGTNVHNVTQDNWYWTIQQAVNEANTGDKLLVYPSGYPNSGSGIYNENIEISPTTTSASNLIIVATNWEASGIIDTVIDGAGGPYAISVSSNCRIELHGFKIKNSTWDGIDIVDGSSDNLITHNIFYSNNPTWSGNGMPPFGVSVWSSGSFDNVIASNKFYNNVVDIGILGGQYNSVFSNQLHDSSFEGIALADNASGSARHNNIFDNTIYNMANNGIGFHSSAMSNNISNNEIYNSSASAFYFEGDSSKKIRGNIFSDNNLHDNVYGFYVNDGASVVGSHIVHNIIKNNTGAGFYSISSNCFYNSIKSNSFDNVVNGIAIGLGGFNVIASNRLEHNTNAIYLSSSFNNIIEHNILKNNSAYGFVATNAPSTILKLNNIISNNIGIWMMSGTNTYMVKNNLYSNTYNGQAPVDGNGQYYTNNWWGTTIYTNITNTLLGGAPPSSELAPWRLFGPFDISYGADTDTPTGVTNLHSGIINGNDVVITWNSSSDTGGGAVARYFIYKTYTNSGENLSRAQVVGEASASATSWTDVGGWTGIPVYYTVTALDDYGVFTNESWYKDSTSLTTNVWNVTKNTYYNTIKEAIYDADGSGIFNEIRVLKAMKYDEKGIVLNNDQNIKLVSSEWLNNGTYNNSIISATNLDVNSIFYLRGNAQLDIQGFTIQFAGTNEDFSGGNVSGAIKYDDSSSGTVKHINFDGLTNGKMGILGWGGPSPLTIESNYFTGFKKAGINISRSENIIANIFTNNAAGVELDSGSANSLVSNNIFKNCNDGIMFWQNVDNQRIVFNLFLGSKFTAIDCENGSHPEIINNTIVYGLDRGISVKSNCNPTILNNIIFSNNNDGIWSQSSSSYIDYNNVFGNAPNYGGNAGAGGNDISTNNPPVFIGGSPYNYHLADGSPSIAAGENGVDQGCYPYNALLRISLGDHTKPVGTFQASEQDVSMVQIKLKTETSHSVLLTDLTFTNYGTGLTTKITNVDLYADGNNNGLLDGSDTFLTNGKFLGINKYLSFSSLNLTINGDSETNLLIIYNANNAVPLDTYYPHIVSSDVKAETNSTTIQVYGNVTGRTQTVSSGIDHFDVSYSLTNYYNVLTPITVSAMDSNNLIISSYNGTISNWMANDTVDVFWTNRGQAHGTLIDGGPGADWSFYTFDPSDNGSATFFVMYSTNGILNLHVQDTNVATATNNTSPIFFIAPPVWNVSLDKYYGSLKKAIGDASPITNNEIRIMYSYDDGHAVIATNTTSATQFYITSQAWVEGNNNTSCTLNSKGYETAFTIDSLGRPFNVKIEGLTVKNADKNGIELLANTSSCTIANMVMLSNGETVSNDHGLAGYGIYISDNQQMPTFHNTIYSNEIYFSHWGILIIDADYNQVFDNVLKYNRNPYDSNDGGGMAIASMGATTTNNQIFHNTIISNLMGTYIGYNGNRIYKNSVYSNTISHNGYGAFLDGCVYNILHDNYVAHNTNAGIFLKETASYNSIYLNSLFTNANYGIIVSSSNYQAIGNTLAFNYAVGNESGIYLFKASDTSVFGNTLVTATNGLAIVASLNSVISNNQSSFNKTGLYVTYASNTRIKHNQFKHNSEYGAYFTNSPATILRINNIESNYYGLAFKSGTNSILTKNNIFGNITNVCSPSITGIDDFIVANNWWGTTIWTNIQKTIEGSPPHDFFKPWRLFGEFNIAVGSDTFSPVKIVNLMANTNGPQIKLQWKKSLASDFARYFVYRSTNDAFTNFSKADVVAQIGSVGTTNYFDNPPSSRRWYYRVTALDSGGGTVYTNESWYSAVASASNTVSGFVHVLPPNENWFSTIQAGVNGATNNNIIEVLAKPGGFNESVSITDKTNLSIRAYDWANSGDNSTTIIDGTGFDYAVKITNSKLVKLLGFSITGATHGVYIAEASVSNYITHNIIYSNETAGLYISSDTADNNFILSNNIWGTNQTYGIYISAGDRNTIQSNQIHNNQSAGIYFTSSATTNYITKNAIYSNDLRGIYISSDTADNNSILTNNIWGMNQNYGIYIYNGDRNTIQSNQIHNNQYDGIYFSGSATTNYITKNTIYSNDGYGIYIPSDTANNNFILTNNIYGINQAYGIYIYDGDRNIISLNQIHNNQNAGIYFFGSASTNYITKNAIYSNDSYGVYIYSDTADNNSILSNNIWGMNQNYGIYISDGDWNTISSNQIHNNAQYGIVFGGSATNNYITKNAIYSNNSYGIYIISEAADNNYILTNNIWGMNQTSGISIVNGDRNTIRLNQIHNNKWYGIYFSVSASTNYITKNSIYSNDLEGIYISVDTADDNYILTNNIWGMNQDSGIYIKDGDRTTIQSNQIHNNQQYGIYFSGSATTNYITKNAIYYNNNYGIYINSDTADNNSILANNIYGTNQNYGICISDGDWNTIRSNQIHNNPTSGICLAGSATNNYITKNTIYSNDWYGIYIPSDTADNNFILTNNIYGINQNYGIFISNGDGLNIYQNRIYNNQMNAIYIGGSTNTIIKNNEIYNTPNGISYENSLSSIYLNSITNNTYGVRMVSGSFLRFNKNNLQNNSVCAFTNSTVTPVIITNNWFGTTLASNIAKKVLNNGGYANFTPYRLFGPFDITQGADTDRLPEITFATAVSTVGQIDLTWTKPADTTGFSRYFVYRSTLPGTTNLSPANIIWQTNNVDGTNFSDTTANVGINYYYHITALDDATPYTNECWYSPAAVGYISGEPHLYISKTVDKPFAKPYETLKYTISFSNASAFDVKKGAVVMDNLPKQVQIITNTAEVSNTSPFSSTISVEYYITNGGGVWTNSAYDTPATVQNITRVRWIFPEDLSSGQKGSLMFKVLVK